MMNERTVCLSKHFYSTVGCKFILNVSFTSEVLSCYIAYFAIVICRFFWCDVRDVALVVQIVNQFFVKC